jgi:L-iditol 2-dehydrogenase
MKAAIYPGHGKGIVIEELPDPHPAADDLIIKVHRCGICGTDLSMTKGGLWDFGVNVQFGHEYAGEVVEMGARVTGFRIGERISVLPSPACGHCEACRSHGNHVLCQNKPGRAMVGFAELARVPTGLAIKLPNTLSTVDGALIEPLAISLYGVKLARIEPGDRVLVLGGGTVALYAIYWARRLGAGRIVAMSRSNRRRDLALQMGANSFIAYGQNEIGDVKEALGGAPQLVFECVGAEGLLSKAIQHVAQFGRIVSLGFCTTPDPIVPAMGSYKCASIQFAVGYSMKEFIYIAEQMDKGHVDPKTIITCDIALTALPAMIEQLRAPNCETKVHVRL